MAALLSWRGSPLAARWSLGGCVVAEGCFEAAGEGEVVLEVRSGLGQVEVGEFVAGGDALIEGGVMRSSP